MAVLAYRGDLRRLSCDAWYLPADFIPFVNPGWTRGDPGLAAAVRDIGPLPDDFGVDGRRVIPLSLADRRRATPVLAAIPNEGTNDWKYHRETLGQFVELARSLPRPAHMADRPRRLLAVPLIGTGASTWQPDIAQHLLGLLDELHRPELADVDLVLVLKDERQWSAVQALRRRRLVEGVDPEIAHLRETAEILAARARQGRLVLFTGSGIGLPAGLPDWRLLLRDLAARAGMDDEAATQLAGLDVLDQAAILSRRLGSERLADEVADRLDAPHHALVHGLLAGLPVTENVTLNYDRLHEKAAEAAARPLAVLPYEPAQDRWLLKLHGCVQADRRHDIVLTRADYLSLGQHRAILTGLVQALLVTRHMLFIGFGLTDPHLHAVLHDVRRALGADRQDRLGTALVLSRHQLQEELWREDLDLVPMGGDTVPQAARRLELFLDLVLLLATTSDAHLFDPAYVDLLTGDERELRYALEGALGSVRPGESPAWERVASLLADLGWPDSPTGTRRG